MLPFLSESITIFQYVRIVAVCLLTAPLALAHDLAVLVQLAPPAVIARASYAGTEPAPFAKVLVYSPGSAHTPYQSGNADKHGTFSFVPDVPGRWRISIDDEMGHVTTATVEVPHPFEGSAAAAQEARPRWERAVIGLMGIAGAAGLFYAYQRRRTL